jgi:GTP-binding protein HflX
LLIKLVDISSPVCFQQLDTVDTQLLQIGLHEKPSLVVFNKIDDLEDSVLKVAKREYPQALFVSARKMLRLSMLRQAILNFLQRDEIHLHLKLSLSDTRTIATLRNHAEVTAERYEDDYVQLELFCYRRIWNYLQGALDLESATISEIKRQRPDSVKST